MTFEDLLSLIKLHLPEGAVLDAESSLREAGLDSFGVVSLLFSLEDHLGTELPETFFGVESLSSASAMWLAVRALASGA